MAVIQEKKWSILSPNGGSVILLNIIDDEEELPSEVRWNNVIYEKSGKIIWRIKRNHAVHGGSVIAVIGTLSESHFLAESYDGVTYEVGYLDGTASSIRYEKN